MGVNTFSQQHNEHCRKIMAAYVYWMSFVQYGILQSLNTLTHLRLKTTLKCSYYQSLYRGGCQCNYKCEG